MNCKICIEKIDNYLEGKLSKVEQIQIRDHLKDCSICMANYNALNATYQLIFDEKKEISNPFLATRVMASIEAFESNAESKKTALVKVLKPILLSVSVAAAIFIGITIGNITKPITYNNEIPVELSYLNDAAIESVSFFSQD